MCEKDTDNIGNILFCRDFYTLRPMAIKSVTSILADNFGENTDGTSNEKKQQKDKIYNGVGTNSDSLSCKTEKLNLFPNLVEKNGGVDKPFVICFFHIFPFFSK